VDDKDFAARLWTWIQGHRQASTYGGLVIVACRGAVVVESYLDPSERGARRHGVERSPTGIRDQELPVGLERAVQCGGELLGNAGRAGGDDPPGADPAAPGPESAGDRAAEGVSRPRRTPYTVPRRTGCWVRRTTTWTIPRKRAEAYEQAAAAAQMDFLRAQFLSDAGRAWVAAGDTTKAIAAYQTIVSRYDSLGTAVEAKVRLGELSRGAWKAPAK